jgi:hypothetical protein
LARSEKAFFIALDLFSGGVGSLSCSGVLTLPFCTAQFQSDHSRRDGFGLCGQSTNAIRYPPQPSSLPYPGFDHAYLARCLPNFFCTLSSPAKGRRDRLTTSIPDFFRTIPPCRALSFGPTPSLAFLSPPSRSFRLSSSLISRGFPFSACLETRRIHERHSL